MASDFEYLGVQNLQCGFREKSTGMTYWLNGPERDDAPVALLDGDEVVIPTLNGRAVWSIRERRILRSEFGA